jgi:hypothetical protein
MNLNKYKEKLKKIKQKNLVNYEYEYWSGNDYKMEKNDMANIVYGNTREGYEKYKRENPDSCIDYADTSLRKVIDKVSNKTIGYITEKKLSSNPYIDEVEKIYKDALEYTKKHLKVEDEDSFMYYVLNNIEIQDFRRELDNFVTQINRLDELIYKYETDEEFKRFFNKIIK